MSDLRQLLDLQFDLGNNDTEASASSVNKRMSTLRQLRDPHTMTRLAQLARQRPPLPPPPSSLQAPPGRFNNFRYPPPAPQPFLGVPPPPFFQQQQQQQFNRPIQQDPGLFYDDAGHYPNRHNEREFHIYYIIFATLGLFSYIYTILYEYTHPHKHDNA